MAYGARLRVGLGGETERMPAVLADVFGVPGTTGHEPDAMRGEQTDQRMPDRALPAGVLQKAVATMARVLDEPVARGHG